MEPRNSKNVGGGLAASSVVAKGQSLYRGNLHSCHANIYSYI